MKSNPRLLDDIARVAGGAVNVLSGLRAQIREEVRARVDEMAARLDLVPREDFERLEAILIRTRQEQESLERRLAALESPAKPTPKTPAEPDQKKKMAGRKKSV